MGVVKSLRTLSDQRLSSLFFLILIKHHQVINFIFFIRHFIIFVHQRVRFFLLLPRRDKSFRNFIHCHHIRVIHNPRGFRKYFHRSKMKDRRWRTSTLEKRCFAFVSTCMRERILLCISNKLCLKHV